MVCMTKQQFETELEKIQKRNETIEYRRRLREERWKTIPKFTKPSTSKIALFVSGLICIEVLVYCQYMIDKLGDASALYAMVGVPVAFMPIVLGYLVKSTKENTAGGITYETAMAGLNNNPAAAQPAENTEAVG